MRVFFALTSLALGLNACAPEGGGGESTPNTAPGYELASAQIGNAAQASPKVIDVSVAELVERLETGHTVLIDLRSDAEVAGGMIEGAVHIPVGEFDPSKIDISPYDHVLFYCHSGDRSKTVAKQYSAHSGKPELHLAGGIKAWRAAGLGTVSPKQ